MVTLKKILNDDVQLIRLYPNTALTPAKISQVLQKAHGNKMYAKFYTDKYFIQVNFARDGNISVSSNIRHQRFLQDLWKKNQQGCNLANVKAFVFQWMKLSRRVLH